MGKTRTTAPQCSYCGAVLSEQTRTRDHIVPRSKGGTGIKGNTVHACKRCNSMKGTKSLEQFRNYCRLFACPGSVGVKVVQVSERDLSKLEEMGAVLPFLPRLENVVFFMESMDPGNFSPCFS